MIKEWGVKGQMKALPLIDSFYLLAPENEISVILQSGFTEAMKIKSLKKLNKYALVSFYGINDPETALKYRGAILNADKSLLPALQEEEYFYEQIIGLAVYTTDGDIIGKVSEIFETGSNDVYVVKGLNKEYLIPAIRDVIKEINLNEEKIIIQTVEGLLD
ncbi:MAG: ribosome maturation factor RimM [Thermodesulfovibrionales bacterium]